ncbi:MAG: 1-deoxy-D-xylulose-5-phosphate reductoisomerase [Firmicutes bacterium]|nr:1-deoxy-D-xylulose-5-phosphate reductoisomerase [Bacillota bacterium]
MPVKNIAVLGSTGSIGKQALEVVEGLGGGFKVEALAAGTNWRLLASQARKFRPRIVVISQPEFVRDLKGDLQDLPCIEVLSGEDGLEYIVSLPSIDIVLNAVVGIIGLKPTVAALRAGKKVALANKETLVAGGEMVMREVGRSGSSLVPVDSEHSAIFQCLQGQDRSGLRSIYLTASGGAFRDYDLSRLNEATPEEALKHPTWQMGPKVTIDSATFMNKCLEVIEARWLFDLKPENIHVLVHPSSIVHSLVEFKDGAFLAQLGVPDMRIPIQYALTCPARIPGPAMRLDLAGIGRLEFYIPDPARYPALELGYHACKIGGTLPAVMNAANEIAVGLFLTHRIKFTSIARLVSAVMEKHDPRPVDSIDAVLSADRWARNVASEIWKDL